VEPASDDFRTAIALIKRGDKTAGRSVLLRQLRQTPENEMAWLWLAETLESESQRIEALQRCLRYNPESQRARKALQYIQDRLAVSDQDQTHPESADPKTDQKPLVKKAWFWMVLAAAVIIVILMVLALLRFGYLS